MSYKFDSLITILNKLDSGEEVTVNSLINDLEISERTAYRYIQTLQVAGYLVVFDRKKNSYAFSEGYSLKRPNLSVEETLAFALAKKLMGNFGAGMEQCLNRIEDKLSAKKASLPGHIVLSSEPFSPETERYLGLIHQAITNFRKIEIELVYSAMYSGEKTVRKVDPYYLFFHDGFWHLRGYCNLRKDLRTFALDRIASLKALNEHFVPKGISPEDELSKSFAAMGDGKPLKVVLRFDEAIKPYVLRKKWHQSQKEKELKDGRLELQFSVNDLEGIKQWIYRWLPYVEVVNPKRLRMMVNCELKEAVKRHKAVQY
jgi:predicted DNA-binding transcriptional regulator YafY